MSRGMKYFLAALVSAVLFLFVGLYLVGIAEVQHFTKSGPVDLSDPNAFSHAFSDPTFSTTYSWGLLTLPGMHWGLTLPLILVAFSSIAIFLVARSNKRRNEVKHEPDSPELPNVRLAGDQPIDPPVIPNGAGEARPLVVAQALLGLGLLVVLLIIGVIFTYSLRYIQKPQYTTYEDCILGEIGASQSEAAVVAIRDACRGKFPIPQAEIEASRDSARTVDEAAAAAAATVDQAAMDAGLAVEGAEESE